MTTFRDRLAAFIADVDSSDPEARSAVATVQKLLDTAVPADTIVPAIDAAISAEPAAYARVLLSRSRDAAIGDYIHSPSTTTDR